MTIVITGANGFIGSALFRTLKKKHKVLGIDKTGESKPDFMVWNLLWDVPFYSGEYEKLNKIHGKIDLVIHCANNVGVKSISENPKFFQENLRLDEWAINLQYKEPKIIYISSSEVYGNNMCCDESDVCKIRDLERGKYALSKLVGEALVRETHKDWVILRPFNITGPGQNTEKGVIPKLIDSALKGQPLHIDPEAQRSFMHISDFVNGVEKIINNFENYNNSVYNIGSETSISIGELAEMILKRTKSKSKIIKIEEKFIRFRCPSEEHFEITKNIETIINDTTKHIKHIKHIKKTDRTV